MTVTDSRYIGPAGQRLKGMQVHGEPRDPEIRSQDREMSGELEIELNWSLTRLVKLMSNIRA